MRPQHAKPIIVLQSGTTSDGKTQWLRGMSRNWGPICTTDLRQAKRFNTAAEAAKCPALTWPASSFTVKEIIEP